MGSAAFLTDRCRQSETHAHRVGGNKWGDRESHLSHVYDTRKRLEEVNSFSVICVGVLCNSALFVVPSLFHSRCVIGLSHSEPQMADGTVAAFGGAGTVQTRQRRSPSCC